MAFDPNVGKVFCTQRGLRAIKYSANVVDSAFGGAAYATRLQRYADRGFCAAVPYYSPDRVSVNLLRGRYIHFKRSGLLLHLGRFAPKAEFQQANLRLQQARYRRATAVSNLARLIILDAGRPIVQDINHDRPRPGELACLPFWTGETGQYIVVTGIATAENQETAGVHCAENAETANVLCEGEDFYVSLSRPS